MLVAQKIKLAAEATLKAISIALSQNFSTAAHVPRPFPIF